MKSKHSDKISKPDVQQDKVNSSESQEAVAIVGMSGRFAKSANLQQLWQHLAAGDDLVEEATRWELADYDSGFNAADTKKGCSRFGSFVEDMDKFDPLFFNISGIEAKFMDPQHRVFMEEAWRALEDASALGAGADLSRCGVYAGCSEVDYLQLYDEATDEKMPPQAWWGNSNSILAARIAYHLDMQGPAVAIDTACSSSLVAIHLACQGLRLGEIDMALAGGVTLMPTANFYLDSGRAGMLSTKGHCHTFDAAADGFVPGEGVGVVVLKRLSTALAAGDQIYGVIKGSGMNQDGASNGIVAPRGIAQEQLERDVYDRFSINPEHIDYVEAHGTGTALGDPIEFRALTNTFKRYTQKKNFCGIGSIKTNIGHTLTAAGVAGVIKVLLSLQHKKLPPSLHFQKGNPAIDFDNSPFFVTTELTPWERQDERKRMAAISSFGFSGTNAHVVIEEAPEPARTQATAPGYLIVLSANNDAELKQQAQNLCEFLTDESVADISFSLLTGRRHFATRLAVVAQDTEELKKALAVWLDKGRSSRVMVGTVAKSSLKDDKPLKEFGNQCIAQLTKKQSGTDYLEKLSTVAQLFIQGFQLQFSQLFQAGAARKVSLPTYPFARGSYWFDKADLFENKTNIKRAETKAEQAPRLAGSPLNQASAQLHPLLHENTSTCFVTRFSSTFTGEEFFFADHQVQGNKVLPGVAHLEMARAAIAMAMELEQDADQDSDQFIQLSEVVWRKPVMLTDTKLRLHIELTPRTDTELQFHIYSLGLNGEEILYSQGVGRFVEAEKSRVDIASLQRACQPNVRSADDLYAQFLALGLSYGAGHQGLVELRQGLDHQQRPFVLAQLRQPETPNVAFFQNAYGLHPGMLDSALQASIGLSGMVDAAKAGTPLPFALTSVAIHQDLPEQALAWVRYSEGCQPNDSVQKLDISVCDKLGQPCVEFKGFSSRILKATSIQASQPKPIQADILLLQPEWQSAPIEPMTGELKHYNSHLVLLVGAFTQKSHAELEQQLPASITCKRLVVANGALVKRYSQAAERVIAEIQQLVASRSYGTVLVHVVISTQDTLENTCFAGLSGLLKTAAQENPKLYTQCILLSETLDSETLSELIQTNAQDTQATEIRYQAKLAQEKPAREVKSLTECSNLPEARPLWKDRGVYLITGGLGGLGLIFAREIAARTTQATVILTGRSALDPTKQREIDQLIQAGLTVDYQIVNVAERDEVDALLASIQKKYAGLTAIVHSAGVIRDNFIQTKTQDEIRQVLAPKVAGLVNLDEASQDMALEQFICFSSSAGAFGNPGQADYAAANAFMDAYAHYRNALCTRGQRSGHTLSINWPLWQQGGMQVHPAVATALGQKGLSALPSEQGIEALYRSAALGVSQVLVLCGQAPKIRALLALEPSSVSEASVADSTPPKTEAVAQPAYDERSLLSKVQNLLLQQVAGQLKLALDDLDLDSQLSEFGFDSISLTEMGNELNQRFQITLTPTLFFEYPSLGEFAGYLVKEHGDVIARELRGGQAKEADVPVATAVRATPDTQAIPERSPLSKRATPRVWKAHAPFSDSQFAASLPAASHVAQADARNDAFTQSVQMPIAIIGISGCFPGAADVEQFWQNLDAGKDCISEIPADRWDWQSIYGDPATEVNKTNIKWGGFIEGIDQFDPLFFGISPREALSMDPQQRLLMTHAWQAIEDAGYAPSSLSGTDTAVIVGTVPSGYSNLLERSGASIEAYTATGMAASVGPNRISYLLNLHGPSEPIETACSSSLVAIHRAVELIRRGRCGIALAGGINTLVTPDLYIAFSKSGMLCEDGRCKTFSDQANGYVRGEGAGMLVLKSLEQAERDGDHIYGTILATSENHGGRANSLTAPNPNAQADLLVAAYREAGIDPRTVTYIEAHGTGTELGDPVEINGLKIAFKKLYQSYESGIDATQCGIGSVKSNIGHLELSAGVAGVIKVLLQMQHQTLAKSLHCETLNPYIDLKDSPFYVVQDKQEWKSLSDAQGQPIPRRAGVSSFGFGGVNAHVVLEEYLPKESQPKQTPAATQINDERPAVILLSAKNSDQLREQARNLLRFVQEKIVAETKVSNADLLNIAYTLQVGRDAMDERLAFLATSAEHLIAQLKNYERDASGFDVFRGSVRQGKEAIAIFLQDDDAQELTRTWLEKGKYEKLLKLWVKGLNVDWTPLYQGHCPARISLPTYPFAKNSYWVARESLAIPPTAPRRLETDLASADPVPAELGEFSQIPVDAVQVLEILKASAGHADQRKVLLVYLRRLVAKAIQISEDEIDENGDFASDYGVDSMAGMMLIREIKNDLDITLYPRELAQIKSLSGLVAKMLEVFDEVHGGKVIEKAGLPADAELNSQLEMLGSRGFNDQTQNLGPIGFVLSSPRSGSTLLRTMLAGHPAIFAPPELHLLNYATMQDRHALLKDTLSMTEGLQRAFMELHHMDADASKHYQQKMVDENWSVADVYGDLIQSVKGRLLIDKSPSYAGNPGALARAEVLFKRAKYIHLIRHPHAVIESFTRMRMDKLFTDDKVDRFQVAEDIWTQFNQNIQDFFDQFIPEDRKLVVHYEALIRNPASTLQQISRFLEVDFHPEMLNPYAQGRMTDGIYSASAQIGDPNFLKHQKIEVDLADSWQQITLPRALQGETQMLAEKYGYQLPRNGVRTQAPEPETKEPEAKEPEAKEYVVDVNGVPLSVCEWGNPQHPPVLCVHGMMDQGLVWKPVAQELVAQGYRVIAPDLRGHGCSSHLSSGETYYDVDAFVQDLKGLLSHLNIAPVVLVGHSLGSVISARLAASYPDRVQALVLVETVLIGADQPSDEQEYFIPDSERYAHQPLKTIESAIERLGIFMPSSNEGFLRELAQRATVEGATGELMWRWDAQLRKRRFFSGPHAAFNFRKSYLEQLRAMEIPTLVLQADKSGHRRAVDQQELNHALANARTVQLRGGHNLHLEHPATVAGEIFRFIQANSDHSLPVLAQA